jgi:hypothetical protein
MIQETLEKLDARLRAVETLKDENRRELLQLVATLRHEVEVLSRTDSEQAESIAGFAAVSAHEATRDEKNDQLLKLSLGGLAASVEGFEHSHPRLVQVVDRICTTLASLGI